MVTVYRHRHRSHVRRQLGGRSALSPTYSRLKQLAGPPRAESVAVKSIQHTTTRRNLMSAFLTLDDGRLQYHRPGPRLGESSSQVAARNEIERIQRHHRTVRRDPDAQAPSPTPNMSEIYARDH
ncbi:uncharacterized protein CPUR_08640 [Claviceps purpurea 20.1]|uniref:Uncharacterized protein n=1 Tax=Claviceps purpurea (strain 20.1) TaxID=1111077 RepID=M1WIL8_CLAP2|nr:hypothetical protein E4U37_000355 [Claviceps purpurea]CCE34704.1 uncharacterized protein CPUR_08640 [Claviceps purpurea 20.1]KAG6153550.1 hypothetical protein E4U51_000236 [Claviceps purpurea]KAG6176749.1 hypothetical protein E4U10_000450 [Claviceps purpurea]KAG6205500.1 hypothetical protein E4U50_004644 [Claviceps purpurea]